MVDIDITTNLWSKVPDSFQHMFKYPELAENFEINMKSVSGSNKGHLFFSFKFDDQDDIEKLFIDWAPFLGIEPSDHAESLKEFKKLLLNYNSDFKNGFLRIEYASIMQNLDSLYSKKTFSPVPNYSNFETLLTGETKTIIHLPETVEFTNDPTAIIVVNTVTFTDNLFQELLDGKMKVEKSDRIIKFKK